MPEKLSDLQSIKAHGFLDEFEEKFTSYFLKEAGIDKMLTVIDKHGLVSPEVLKKIGEFQRAGILKPGLIQLLKIYDVRLKHQTEAPSVTVESRTKKGKEKAKKAAEEKAKAKAKEEDESPTEGDEEAPEDISDEVEPETAEDELGNDEENLAAEDSDDSEVDIDEQTKSSIAERIKAERKKMEEKIRQREQKLLAQAQKKQQAKAERLGLKAEEAAAISALKEKIAGANKEIKLLREQIAGWKQEIAVIRPKKEPSAAAAKPKVEIDKKLVAEITKFLKTNPSGPSEIMSALSIDKDVYGPTIRSMIADGTVTKSGRGPFTKYEVA